MPEPVDLPAIRAEGRRLKGETTWAFMVGWLWEHADALLADPTPGDRLTEAPTPRTDEPRDEGWAIAIISNVDAPEAGWPNQTEEWRTAARGWLDSTPAASTMAEPTKWEPSAEALRQWGEEAAGFAEWLTPERYRRFFTKPDPPAEGEQS